MNKVLLSNLELFTHQDFFSKKLIDSIPGVFYVYKEYGQSYKLFTCNKQHLMVTGYTAEESIGQEPFFFVNTNSYASIEKGLSNIKTKSYVNQVYASFLTKSKEIVPYVFEGYGFEFENENYFMGVGSDISDLVLVNQELKLERLKRANRDKELLTLALRGHEKESLLVSIANKLERIVPQISNKKLGLEIKDISKRIYSIEAVSNNHWNDFESLFMNVHESFYNKLRLRHATISKTELQYCALVKINLSNQQICNVLNISMEGLKKKKYRLKQKIGLHRNQKLEQYITSL